MTDGSNKRDTVTSPLMNVNARYALTPMQQGMLFHNLRDPRSGVDIEQIVCTLREEIDLIALQRAWQRITQRHAVLRSSIHWDGTGEAYQEVHGSVEVPVEVNDWRNLPPEDRAHCFETCLMADRTRGFALDTPPSMRLALFQFGEADYRLVWTFPHALLDGRSFTLLLKEVFAFYEAHRTGNDFDLPEPRPFREFVEWLQRQDLAQAENFWRPKLKGFTAPTPLPLQDEPGVGPSPSGVCRLPIDRETTSRLQALALEHGLTLNTFLQGAWALLLSRFNNENDVVFGAVRAGRKSAFSDGDSMIGLMINSLPVRVQVSEELRLLPWLKELRAQQIAVRSFEHTPLIKLHEWSDLRRDTPLFSTLLVFENYSLESHLQAQGGCWKQRRFELREKTNFPLTIYGYAGAEFLLQSAFHENYLSESGAVRLLGHLQTLLQAMARAPGERLSGLPILNDGERHQLLVRWNQTRIGFSEGQCVHQAFEARLGGTNQKTTHGNLQNIWILAANSAVWLWERDLLLSHVWTCF